MLSAAGFECPEAVLPKSSKGQQNQYNLTSKVATSKLPDGGHVHVTQSRDHLSPDGSKESISSQCG